MSQAAKTNRDELQRFLARDQEYVRSITLSIEELIYPIVSVVRRLGCYPYGAAEYCNGQRIVWGPAIVREDCGLFSVFNCSVLNTREPQRTSKGFRRNLAPAVAVKLYLIAEPFDYCCHEMFR